MLFNGDNDNNGYIPCPFDKRFLIYKIYNLSEFQLCVDLPYDFPKVIGWVGSGDPGKITDAHNLGWKINEDFRNLGLMSNLLDLYFQEITPKGSCFAVVILKTNLASLRLAQKSGFIIYDEDDDKLYLKKI